MRKIKFRGKNYGGIWLYGYLMPAEKPVINKDCKYRISVSPQSCAGKDKMVYEVISDTIGQFTGLHDKNGKEIYEGDVIKIYDSVAGCVRYNAKYWRYEVAAPKEPIDNERIPSGKPSECWEIIGNIHDDLELLKTEE